MGKTDERIPEPSEEDTIKCVRDGTHFIQEDQGKKCKKHAEISRQIMTELEEIFRELL